MGTSSTAAPDRAAPDPAGTIADEASRAAVAGFRPSTLHALPITPIFRPVDTGLSHPTLRRLLQAGVIEKVGHGLYRRLDAPLVDLDLAEVAARASLGTLCLVSALAHHDLVTAIPERHDIALPRGHGSVVTPAPVAWHYFDAATFDVGRSQVSVEGTSATIGLYSAERSIADAFRLRHQVGQEIAVEALRTWLRRPQASPADLLRVAAALPRARRPITEALAVLL